MHSSSRPSHHAASASRSSRSASSASLVACAARAASRAAAQSWRGDGGERRRERVVAVHRLLVRRGHGRNARTAPAQLDGASWRPDVLEHRAQVVGGAELDEDDALVGPAGVAAGPVVEVAGLVHVLGPVGVAHVDGALHDVAPVGALAQVAGEALEERREVGARREVDVADELPAPVLALRVDLADLQLGGHLVHCLAHLCLPFGLDPVSEPAGHRALRRLDAASAGRRNLTPPPRRRWGVHPTRARSSRASEWDG